MTVSDVERERERDSERRKRIEKRKKKDRKRRIESQTRLHFLVQKGTEVSVFRESRTHSGDVVADASA